MNNMYGRTFIKRKKERSEQAQKVKTIEEKNFHMRYAGRKYETPASTNLPTQRLPRADRRFLREVREVTFFLKKYIRTIHEVYEVYGKKAASDILLMVYGHRRGDVVCADCGIDAASSHRMQMHSCHTTSLVSLQSKTKIKQKKKELKEH